ncbi:MAG: hypothetical protein ACOC7T_01920 [Planctomycetota bacterium]
MKKIDADTLEVSAGAVGEARIVRYNWANNPTGNLVNSDMMAAGAFEARKESEGSQGHKGE